MQKFLLNSKLWVKLVEHIGCFLTPPPFPLNISALQLILPVFCLLHNIGEMESSLSPPRFHVGNPIIFKPEKHTHTKKEGNVRNQPIFMIGLDWVLTHSPRKSFVHFSGSTSPINHSQFRQHHSRTPNGADFLWTLSYINYLIPHLSPAQHPKLPPFFPSQLFYCIGLHLNACMRKWVVVYICKKRKRWAVSQRFILIHQYPHE